METYPEEVALLVAQAGPLNGQRWALREGILIGRDASCDVVIADRQVSRHHARLSVQPDGIVLEDLDSKNGTHRNGEAIAAATYLQDGDVIQIALSQQFIFLSSDSTVPLEGDIEDLIAMQSAEPRLAKPEIHRLSLEKRSRRVFIYRLDKEIGYQKVEILPPLSVSQFHLLEALYNNQGRVVPRSELVEAVWGAEQAYEVSEQALDALVRRLRDRIADTDSDHAYVVTVRGHGLRLDNPVLP
jgi:pSer/pThr/pTyr-binding forkhead associated (FHA) protein